jgi:hypothetical protein
MNTFEDAGIKFENDEVKYGVELLKEFKKRNDKIEF